MSGAGALVGEQSREHLGMDWSKVYWGSAALVWLLMSSCCVGQCLDVGAEEYSTLSVNASEESGRPIPETLFGIFFEEINHAGSGGIWSELVNNRGFEAGGPNTPSNIDPWTIIGNEKSISVATERSSCFERNKVALRLDVLCDQSGALVCPSNGVGVYNPGFWGMNIEKGNTYKIVLFVRSSGSMNVSVSFRGNGGQMLASTSIIATSAEVSNWTKKEVSLKATATHRNSRLHLTTVNKGTLWFDQVSAMPLDTYKGHGFRKDLVGMLVGLEPRFLRFPGGSFVEGEWLRNAFRWKETVGPWQERPGHFGDVWSYWTDDGLGYFELLQLAEDLGVQPVWVFNNGMSHQDQIEMSRLSPFVQEALDGIEFAVGDRNSTWGSVRAEMGHPKPFELKYVAIGNEDCRKNYREIYLKFYNPIKKAYPDIKIISNCDGSSGQLDHPTDLYDFHIYKSANEMFSAARRFDKTPRSGPKAFVSEYAVKGKDTGTGSLLAALGEAGFLIGLERNSDVIEMASYAPLFVNNNNRKWNPDAIVFNSWQLYATPSYWVQRFFTKSSGATLHNTTLQTNSSNPLLASAISWTSFRDGTDFLRIKVVNLGGSKVNLKISVDGLSPNMVQVSGSTKTVLTSADLKDVNSFRDPKKVYPVQTPLTNANENMDVELSPYSLTSFDLMKVA